MLGLLKTGNASSTQGLFVVAKQDRPPVVPNANVRQTPQDYFNLPENAVNVLVQIMQNQESEAVFECGGRLLQRASTDMRNVFYEVWKLPDNLNSIVSEVIRGPVKLPYKHAEFHPGTGKQLDVTIKANEWFLWPWGAFPGLYVIRTSHAPAPPRLELLVNSGWPSRQNGLPVPDFPRVEDIRKEFTSWKDGDFVFFPTTPTTAFNG